MQRRERLALAAQAVAMRMAQHAKSEAFTEMVESLEGRAQKPAVADAAELLRALG